MKDLFEREQNIFDQASRHLAEVKKGQPCDSREFAVLVKEYGRALRQLRRQIRMSDRTAVNLNSTRQALLDEVRYDALTGIYNRRYMEEKLLKLIKTLSRVGGATLSLLMIDIDHFKKYNDAYGHLMGDECLKVVAGVLKDTLVRADDFVARYGGEEFVVVLPNTDGDGSIKMAGRLLEGIREAGIAHAENSAADHITISIGATSGQVYESSSGKDFIKIADEALYLSKRNGRNRLTFLVSEEFTE
jgi:diguanylate cyclase (GGDEF)-like protein